MFDFENLLQICSRIILKSFLICLIWLFLPPIARATNHPCVNAFQQLQGDLGVVTNRGGLWSLMEQRELKDKSVIGMQVDGKMARAVGLFEELCESEKKPEKQMFVDIQNLLGSARAIFNPKSSGEELMKSITKLNNKLDTLLAKFK